MFGRVQLESTDHVFAFVAFLQANPELKPLVHTIITTPTAFGPSLLYVLPNLSSIECVDESQLGEPEDEDGEDEDGEDEDGEDEDGEDEDEGDEGTDGHETFRISDYMHSVRVHRNLSVHHTSLACFRRLGAHIHTLRLRSVSFPTSLSFIQMLLAFATITRLVCEKVEIRTESNGAPLEVVIQRLSERMQLKALTIDSPSLTGGGERRTTSPGALLFDSRLAPSIVESLVVEAPLLDPLPHQSDWYQLRHLVLQFSGEATIAGVAEFLERFPKTPRLREVLVEWQIWSHKQIVEEISHNVDESNTGYQAFQKLEHALLRFPYPQVAFAIPGPVDAKLLTFWTHELGKHLPVLLARGGAVTMECKDALIFPAPPHHNIIQALVVSPDSNWVATGSLDSTIILWDTVDGALVKRWVPHSYKPVGSLAFSPDSQYLVSGGDDRKAAIWDLSRIPGQSAYKVATLDGHTGPVLTCAWSPDGDTIATGSEDRTARLWDARTATYHQRAVIRLENAVVSLAFSPDGAWLACGSRHGECCIVKVALGTLHRSLWNSPSGDSDAAVTDNDDPHSESRAHDTVAAFHPTDGSTRLATAPCGSCAGINVADVETGSVLVHMGGKMGELMRMQDVSFSPDGALVLGVPAPESDHSRHGVYVWEAATGVERFKLTEYRGAVRRARFSPCGRYLASTAADQTVRVWRTGDGSCVATLSEHREAVEHVAFSSDGRTLSSGAKDGTVFIRQMRDIVPAEEQNVDLP